MLIVFVQKNGIVMIQWVPSGQMSVGEVKVKTELLLKMVTPDEPQHCIDWRKTRMQQGIDRKWDDEAHFWLNCYVNKQNCRIWSEANPQVYVETPLHPEKLTVWCALWAGGILLQQR
ncbi:hypothetical protein TNCV_4523041 [Trichonephila clavipes]|nr:hypothetical protein TNCV_4523041 [Trichonephila clavipes]